MNYKCIEISELEIKNQSFDGVFYDSNVDRRLLNISIDNKNYLIGWQSDLLIPEIYHNENILAIGIDLKLIIINPKFNETNVYLPLNYFFLKFYNNKNFLIVATELEILIIDLNSYKIITEGLPDIFENLIFDGNKIIINCMDKSTATIEF